MFHLVQHAKGIECTVTVGQGFGNCQWLYAFPNYHVLHLPRSRSDHYPLLVQLGGSKNNLKTPVSFKVLEPGFNIPNLRILGNCWYNSTVLDVALKLQSLSKSPLQWNRCVFWNIFYRKFHCLARLVGAQKALQSWPSNRLELLEAKLWAELDLILAQSVHDHQEMEKSGNSCGCFSDGDP